MKDVPLMKACEELGALLNGSTVCLTREEARPDLQLRSLHPRALSGPLFGLYRKLLPMVCPLYPERLARKDIVGNALPAMSWMWLRPGRSIA